MMTYSVDGNKIEHESAAALEGCAAIKSGKGHLMHIKNSLRAVVIPIGPSIAYVPLTQGKFALIDRYDAERIGKFNWFAVWKPNSKAFYASRKSRKSEGERRNIRMHREIVDPPSGLDVDHISGVTLDNRRCNLRPATRQENCWNRRRKHLSSSGYKGVSWRQDSHSWEAKIHVDGKTRYLGRFADVLEANFAYCRAAEVLHGEFANHQSGSQ